MPCLVEPSDDVIVALTREVCETVLAMPSEPVPAGSAVDPEVMASVHVTGDWQGAVVILCSRHLAEHATAAMFGNDVADTTAADLDDAMGEIANMIGGNFKNRLPVPCKLSLPTVVSGGDLKARFPGARLTTDLRFSLPPGLLGVQVHRKVTKAA